MTEIRDLLSYRLHVVANLLSPQQAMNRSYDRLHLVNTYGAFGSVTRRRKEVVLEGARVERPREEDWREYEFRGKPGDPQRRPPQIAPLHLRLVLPAPVRTEGRRSSVGDETRCVYDRGHLLNNAPRRAPRARPSNQRAEALGGQRVKRRLH